MRWPQVKSGGENIDTAFGAQWDTTVGRIDADSPDIEGWIPAPDASTVRRRGKRQKHPSVV